MFAIPFLVILFSNIGVYRVYKNSQRELSQRNSTVNALRKKKTVKLAVTLGMMVALQGLDLKEKLNYLYEIRGRCNELRGYMR